MENKIKKNKYVAIFLFIFFFLSVANPALARDKFWVGSGDGLVDSTANWSFSSGGSNGASIPRLGDLVTFDGSGVNDAFFNVDMDIGDLFMTADYTGLVTINDGTILTLSTALPTTVVTVSRSGSQLATTSTPVNDLDLGGAFTLLSTDGDADISSIALKYTGSLSSSSISNIRVSYKQQETCSATKPGDATLFDTVSSFDVNDVATTTGDSPIALVDGQKVCVYIVYDLTPDYSLSLLGRSIDFEIVNPTTDISIDGGEITTTNTVNIIGQTIISSDEVTSVSSFKMKDEAVNPTVFYLQDGSVWKKEGSSDPVRMTNPNLNVQSINFTYLDGPAGAGAVRIDMTVSNVSENAGASFLNVTKTYTTTVTIRSRPESQ